MPVVSFENVTKRYGDNVVAVDQLSLTIGHGELVCLVGPSGCGKSTTLKLLAGIEDVSSGTIRVDARDVHNVAPRHRDIAMVFQGMALYPHLSVFDNLAFGLQSRRVPKDQVVRRVHETAARLGIAPYLQRRPDELSGGQAQRVALARAMVRQPAIFLFDEPLSHLDAHLRGELRRELKQHHRRSGITTLYVTHDQEEALTLGDRLAVMAQGKIHQVGTPEQVYRRPSNLQVATMIGAPQLNCVAGRLHAEHNSVFFVASDRTLRLPIQCQAFDPTMEEVVLGIRPEGLQLAQVSASDDHQLEADVKLIEFAGREQIVTLACGGSGQLLRACVGAEVKVPPGASRWNVRGEHTHLFNQAGDRLSVSLAGL
ncbi:MAG: ABC transporter ATP-binding protein [Planctomycetales bacterium]|nr:ABC transporter ATP-binding protein [Planctomycetales bacterium]